MQYIIRYDVEQAKTEAFRNWLLESDAEMRSNDRPGWSYLGTWFAVHGFGGTTSSRVGSSTIMRHSAPT